MGWYHHYLNQPGGERLYKTLEQVCYWKGMVAQCIYFCKRCKECQKHKPRKKKEQVPPKNVGTLQPWDTVHTDLIGPYSLTTQQFQPDGSQKEVTFQLTCMIMLDPVTGWFEIVEVHSYLIDQVVHKKITTETIIDKSATRISQLFEQTWLSRYPRPKKVVFDNGSEFKKDFVLLLKDLFIKPKVTTI